MVFTYNEKLFVIDLIASHYNTRNPHKIKQKCKEDMDTKVSTVEVLRYLNINPNERNNIKYTLTLKDIFQ